MDTLSFRTKLTQLIAVGLLIGNYASCSRHPVPQIRETAGPITLEQARPKCPITLPPDARNIQYAIRADATTIESFVRFEIPYEEGIAYASEVFKEHAKIMKEDVDIPEAREITKHPRLDFEPDSDLHVTWFDVDKISRGVVFGKAASWKPQIWIDRDRNLFFYCLTD